MSQSVRGIVVDRADQPVSGVVVQLLDSSAHSVARALSNERGEFFLATQQPGRYRLHTLRIGFHPVTSDAFTLAAGEQHAERVVLAGLPMMLDTFRVAGQNVCRSVGDSGAVTYALWAQVRGALMATQLAAAGRTINATTVAYARTLDPATQRVRTMDARVQTAYVAQPWHAAPTDSLRRFGYVVTDANGWTTYFAPGIETLLSDAFVEDHCFHLVQQTQSVGIAFEPSRERRGTPEIQGTLWIDRASTELRNMTVRFTNVPSEEADGSGADVQFVRLKNGSWVIAGWSLRMPVVVRTVTEQRFGGEQLHLQEIRQTGGLLQLARRGSDTLWVRRAADSSNAPVRAFLDSASAAQGRTVFAGFVVADSTQVPMAAAQVALPELSRATFTNKDGAFRFDSVSVGSHRVLVRHIGYGPLDTVLTFAAGRVTARRIVLTRVVRLDTVVTEAQEARLSSFEENRKVGLGHFLTRADLAKMEGQTLSAVLEGFPGVKIARGNSTHAWIIGTRRPPSLGGTPAPGMADRLAGAPLGCYPMVYLDGMQLFNPGRTTEDHGVRSYSDPLFDLRDLSPESIEAIEWYAGPSETPMKYSALNSDCGVLADLDSALTFCDRRRHDSRPAKLLPHTIDAPRQRAVLVGLGQWVLPLK